jgi:hypothetical protein
MRPTAAIDVLLRTIAALDKFPKQTGFPARANRRQVDRRRHAGARRLLPVRRYEPGPEAWNAAPQDVMRNMVGAVLVYSQLAEKAQDGEFQAAFGGRAGSGSVWIFA